VSGSSFPADFSVIALRIAYTSSTFNDEVRNVASESFKYLVESLMSSSVRRIPKNSFHYFLIRYWKYGS
jgi:hypothetical protein